MKTYIPMSDRRRVTREQALQDFLALGDGRYLRQLHLRYVADTSVLTPSIHTLRSWCHKFGWMEQAQRHDDAVRRATTAINVAEAARARAQLVSQFSNVAHRSLVSALSALEEKSMIAQNTKDLAVLVDVAVRASEIADALERPISEKRSRV